LPPRKITQSSLPRVSKIAAWPIWSCHESVRRLRHLDGVGCDFTPPSVPFLKPTGHDSPLASWRWLWLSVVRAPIAPSSRSLMNCG
jgi:hypothetical protein